MSGRVDTSSSSNIPNSPSSPSASAGDPRTPAVPRRPINEGGGAELTSFTTGKKSNKAPNSSSSVVSEVISGYVQGEFPCVWQNYNGRLIAGSRAVIFHGSFFLFDKTLILQWDDIRQVLHGGNNSNLEIALNDDTVHTFRFQQLPQAQPEKVWLLLVTLHNDALLGRNQQQQPSGRSPQSLSSSKMKRRNSDPSAATGLLPEEEEEESQLLSQAGSSPQNKNRAVIRTVTSFADSVDPQVIAQAVGNMTLQPIHCTYAADSTAGRLYTGSQAIFFTGKRYFWEHLVISLPWSSIRQIRIVDSNDSGGRDGDADDENDAIDNNNNKGLVFETRTHAVRVDGGNEQVTIFQFLQVENVGEAWASLIKLQNENLVAMTPNQHSPGHSSDMDGAPTPSSLTPRRLSAARRRQTLRRMNSDPMLASMATSQQLLNFDYDSGDGGSKAGDDDDDIASVDKDDERAVMQSLHDSADYSIVSPQRKLARAAASVEVDIRGKTTLAASMTTTTDADSAWSLVVAEPAETYSTVVVKHHVLSDCTLEIFHDKFWRDNAPYSLSRYLESRGDSDLRLTHWKNADNDNNGNSHQPPQTRVVQYTHPVNAPFAPPEAAARKEQTLSRYGDSGLLVETKTYVDGVPMADCFYVADRIRAEPTDENNSVAVTMEFGITFIKSTMFKSIISKKTSSEYVDLFEALAQYMSDALAGNLADDHVTPTKKETVPDAEEGAATVTATKTPSPPPKRNWNAAAVSLDRVLLFTFILLQVWVLWELRNLKQSVRRLEGYDGGDGTSGQCKALYGKRVNYD